MCCESHECFCRRIDIEDRHIGHIAFNYDVIFEDDDNVIWYIAQALREFKGALRKDWHESDVPVYNDDIPF